MNSWYFFVTIIKPKENLLKRLINSAKANDVNIGFKFDEHSNGYSCSIFLDGILFGASTGITKYIAKTAAAKITLDMLAQQYPSIEFKHSASKTRLVLNVNEGINDEYLDGEFAKFYNDPHEDNVIFELFGLADQLKIHEKAFAYSMKSQSIFHQNCVQIKVSKNVNYFQLYLYLKLHGDSEKFALREP